ncbi:MAG: TrkH family potassium uptake protein [Spirochaetales bacterium]|nr:TrkH family potassium uptake protein [Spirochaetales bacterium]
MNFLFDIRLIFILQSCISTLMLIPAGVSAYYGETSVFLAFVETTAFVYILTIISSIITAGNRNRKLSARDGCFMTTVSWILATVFGAIPLLRSGAYDTFSKAFFEIMSGFTTTGASVLRDFETCSKGILFWRSMTNWLGGMGFVVLFVAIFPTLGVGGTMLFGAESVGPTKGKLAPKARTTAMALWLIYLGFSVLETLMLLLGGLTPYESVTVTFSTMSCAGFCVKSASIAAFGSAYVDVVVTVFMLIGGTNFALFFLIFTGKFKQVTRNAELRSYLFIFIVFFVMCSAGLWLTGSYPSLPAAMRYSAFQLASILTTTGFATTNYTVWPVFCQFCVFCMMLIGGCAGSTAGGMKVIRVRTLVRMSSTEIRLRVHPRGVFPLKNGNEKLDDRTMHSIAAFCGLYLVIWFFSSLVIAIAGQDFATTLTSTLLTLGNIGIGFGAVSPAGNFLVFPDWTLWVFSFLMMVGRLELYTVLIIFSRSFWKG